MLFDIISPLGPDATAVALPAWLDFTAVAVGALSGVLEAQKRRLDAVGYIGLALVCGLGGGLIRDTIMQTGTVYMLDSSYAIAAALTTALIGFFFSSVLLRIPNLIEWVDIISVGLFVCAGTDKAILYGLNPLAALLMGTLTGVGGGMLRDVFLGEVPRIFERSNFYAICAICGALAYYLGVLQVNMYRPWAAFLCVLVTVAFRRVSLRYNIMSPVSEDVAPHVEGAGRAIYQLAVREGMSQGQRLVRNSSIPAAEKDAIDFTALGPDDASFPADAHQNVPSQPQTSDSAGEKNFSPAPKAN